MNGSITATAAQVILSLVPIVGIAIGGTVVFFYLLWHHHENKLQIKTGTYNPAKFDLKTFSLLSGMLLTAVGFILSVFFAILDGLSYTLLGGFLPMIIGIALLLFYKINPDFHKKDGK